MMSNRCGALAAEGSMNRSPEFMPRTRRAILGPKGLIVVRHPLSHAVEPTMFWSRGFPQLETQEVIAVILEAGILNVQPGQQADFEAALERAKPLISATPGFIRFELHRCVENSYRYLLLVQWESVE